MIKERGDYEPQTRDESQVEIKDILQPFDGGSGLVGENLDEFGTSLISGGFEGIFVESLHTVADAEVGLGTGESTVDTGSGLGGVATEEG